MTTAAADVSVPLVDISSSAFWSLPPRERDASFAVLRAQAPVSFHPPPQGGLIPPTVGFWAVTRHADIVEASLRPETFCSGQGVSFEDIPPEVAEAIASFVVMDAPRHTKLRRLVSQAFTPRAVHQIDAQIHAQAQAVVGEALALGEFDLVEQVSTPLPLWTISEMMGIPLERRPAVCEAANVLVGTNDPDVVPQGGDGLVALAGAVRELTHTALELAAARRSEPGDDLLTGLVQAEVDADRLTDEEIGAFFVLMSVAGNDTTRNTISHGVQAFADHPEQWAALRASDDALMHSAVEELVRWASPVIQFRRTATVDTTLAGVPIAAGDRVVLFYASANRDESVFDDPWSFDVSRSPNHHVGFGGHGPHFCLGANLARTQLRAVFGELARSVTSFEVGPIEYLAGNFISGVKHLPCRPVLA